MTWTALFENNFILIGVIVRKRICIQQCNKWKPESYFSYTGWAIGVWGGGGGYKQFQKSENRLKKMKTLFYKNSFIHNLTTMTKKIIFTVTQRKKIIIMK